MLQSGKSTGLVGYNVQTAVDGKHHLIVAHEVTNIGNDRTKLTTMAMAAREAMGKTKLQAFADRGYFNSLEIKACEDAATTGSQARCDDVATRDHRACVRNIEALDGLDALLDEDDGARRN